jgi:hypothetical protein
VATKDELENSLADGLTYPDAPYASMPGMRRQLANLDKKIDGLEPNTPEYNRAIKQYRELKAKIDNLEQQRLQSSGQVKTAVELRKDLQKAKDRGYSQDQVDRLEEKLAEAERNAVATVKPDDKLRPARVSDGANSGYIPNIQTSQPIYNPQTGTITVVDKNTGEPVNVTRNNVTTPLQNVFIVIDEKKFYERGKESVVRDVKYVSENDLVQTAYSLSKDDRRRLQEDMKRVGLLPKEFKATGDFDISGEFVNAYLNAYTAANQINFNNLQNNLPLQGVLSAYQSYQDQGLGGPRTSVTQQVSIPNREAAAEQLNNLYLNSVGRKATDKEINEFYKKVRSTAKSRPTTTRTTTATEGLGTESSVQTETGFDSNVLESMARESAEARPEFLAYQLSTNFYNALLGASRLPMQFGAGAAPTTGPLG